MSLQAIKTPSSTPDAGIFNLPSKFNPKKHAAEWVEESQVEAKQQRQSLLGLGLTADGWEIWRDKKEDEPTHVLTLNGKKYILMCRDRKVQDEVNAAFGNASKRAINREVRGETAAGGEAESGMVTEHRALGRTQGEVDESVQPLNDERGTASKRQVA